MSLPADNRPDQARAPFDTVAGDPASIRAIDNLKQALTRKTGAVAGLRTAAHRKAMDHLKRAVRLIEASRYEEAAAPALKALEFDETNGVAWQILAIARDKSGHYEQAFSAYEAALRLLPDGNVLANNLGRMAQQLGQNDIAEKLFYLYLSNNPGDIDATNNLATLLRDENRYDEAIDRLREILTLHPESPLLWNTLGTVLTDRGDMQGSLVFFDEALRLEPDFYKAAYNRGNARMALGDPHAALKDFSEVFDRIDDPYEKAVIHMARALTLLLVGDLEAGLTDYEVRFSPYLRDTAIFDERGERWTPDHDLTGRSLLIYGEQGLGDEILFANTLRDAIDAVGPQGRVYLAIENRLSELFRRSYPGVTVVRHHTVKHMGRLLRVADLPKDAEIDLWVPMGSLFRRFRTSLDAFPTEKKILTPDPARVEHWRAVLAEQSPGPKVGFLWKSLNMTGARIRSYSPFELWKGVLTTPDTLFVNLQYTDFEADIEAARAAGAHIWTPEGVNLKDDLDDVAALCAALDVVAGPMTATINIAAAVGTPTWVLTTTDTWTQFGSDYMPCYPAVRIFPADGPGDWDGVMGRLAEAIRIELPARRAA